MEQEEQIFKMVMSHDAYDSLFKKLLKLPEKTLVYPAHDYNGKKIFYY